MPNPIGYMFDNPPDTRSDEKDDILVDSDVYLGIELELEGVQHLRYAHKFLAKNNWRWVSDHSLRGDSCELITGSENGMPIRGMDVATALEALTLAVDHTKEKYGTWPEVGVRTSTHVHVDVRDLTSEQVSRFILYYVMFENILLKSEAPERCDNNYCLPVSKSADLKLSLTNLMDSNFYDDEFRVVAQSWPKYSALNVGAASQLGTIEFRIFPGSFNSKQILRWINIILSLRAAAIKNVLNVKEIPQTISGQGMDVVFRKVFPDDIASSLMEGQDYRTLLRGARLIQSIMTRSSCRSPGYGARYREPDAPTSEKFKTFKARRST